MRFSFLLSGLFAAVAIAESTSAAAPSSVSLSPAQASQEACYKACPEGDVNCQAHCVAVPSPNGSQVNATTQCVADCPQGKGTAADNKAFGDCIEKCISGHYFVTSKGTPEATGSAGGSNAANSNTASAPTGTGSSETSSETGTETGAAPTGSSATKSGSSSSSKTSAAAAQSSTHNAAPAIIASGSAFVGVIAALLAL